MSSPAPNSANSRHPLMLTPSSAHMMSQSDTLHRLHRSRSIPSQFGMRRLPRMRAPVINTSSHPESRIVQKADSRKVASLMVTPTTPTKKRRNGRLSMTS